MNRKCEVCWEEPATIECDDSIWRCDNCAISAGYAYLVDEKDDLFEELEEDEEDDNED